MKVLTTAGCWMYFYSMYQQKDIQKIFPEIKARTVISWQEAGFIVPAQSGKGPGSRRLYSFRNLIEIGTINQLRLSGVPREWIPSYLDRLDKCPIEKDTRWVLVGSRQYTIPGGYVHHVISCRGVDVHPDGRLTIHDDDDHKILHRPYTPHYIVIHLDELAKMIKRFG